MKSVIHISNPFLDSFPMWVIKEYWVEFPVLYNRSLFVIYFIYSRYIYMASLVAQLVKNLPAMWETWVWSLSWEDPLDKGMAIHSNILAWRIPWTVQSLGSQSWTSLSHFHFIYSSVFMSCTVSQFIIHPPFLLVTISFCIYDSIFLGSHI